MSKKWDYTHLDVVSLLESIPVSLDFTGKNVTEGWVNTNCPFCYDPSNHLGVNLTSKSFSCWICREKGTIFGLVKHLTGFDDKIVGRLIREHTKEDFRYVFSGNSSKAKKLEINLPSRCSEKPLKVHKEYLKKRGFNRKELELHFGIKYTGQISSYLKSDGRRSDFSYRIVVPVYMNKKLVNFTARDVTGLAREKYKNCPNDDALFHTKDCIYGYDLAGKGTSKNVAVLVEGPTDVWSIGPGAFGIFGLKYTENQIKAIYKKELKKAYIFFDKEKKAQQIAEKFAKEIGSFIQDVFIIEPEDGDSDDPGSMSKQQARELRAIIGG
jgi:DNA primase